MGVCYDLSKDGVIDLLLADIKERRRDGKSVTVGYIVNGEQELTEDEQRKRRSNKLNKSLHVFCRLLAKALNDAGYDMTRTLKADAEIPWTEESVKENLWRPVQRAMFEIDSTADADSKQYQQIYEVVNRKIGATTGVHVPWPSIENQRVDSYGVR